MRRLKSGEPYHTNMTSILSALDKASDALGRLLALASIAIMAITFLVVVMRYGFNASALRLGEYGISSIALQESVLYLHAILFMLASAYTLKHNGHVRVDVFYRTFSPRTKAWVDLLGTLLLLFPMCGFILYTSLDYVAFSWQIQERSGEAEGLPYIYLLKSLIPAMCALLLIQGLIEIVRNGAIISGHLAPQSEESEPL